MILDWIRRIGTGHHHRRRRQVIPSSVSVERLEQRQLLAATKLTDLPDTAVSSQPTGIALSDYFDDPEITGSTVEVTTPLGSFFIETFDRVTPLTTANFLKLTREGRYDEMFFHRSALNFVVQGGGYRWIEATDAILDVEIDGTIDNEFDNWFDASLGGLATGTPLNVRGTIAMAKQPGNPDSATSEWFVNLGDNAQNLDNQNSGFTVFGRVLFNGMTVVDAIGALPRANVANSPFDSLPLRDYDTGAILRDNVVTSSTTEVSELAYAITENSNPDAVSAVIVDGELQLTALGQQPAFGRITVQATDLQGTSVSSTFELTAGQPGTVIASPADGTNPRPVIDWSGRSGAVSYDLWVSHVGGQAPIIDAQAVVARSFTPTTDLPDGDYRAWVRVNYPSGTSGWSPLYTFTIGQARPSAVTVTSPSTSTVVALRPVIEWTAASGATAYDLWVNHLGVQNQIIRETSLTETSFTPSEDLADGTYRVWVMAKNAAGDSPWSAPITFEIVSGVLRITGPGGSPVAARPEITWTVGGGSGVFELWVNQVGGTARVIHETSVEGLVFTPSTDLSESTYRAWVRENPAGGTAGPWSAPFEFTVGPDTSPGAAAIINVTGTTTGRPTFVWAGADNAVRYELWVNRQGGAARVIHDSQLRGAEFTSTIELAVGSYRAWIRAFNADDDSGAWSSMFAFDIT